MAVFALPRAPIFPDPALADKDGLLAVGGDLSPQRLLAAYALGIFPWYSDNSPILWWSPDPRLVLEPSCIHVPRRLERLLRQGRFTFSLDRVFAQVITRCAQIPRHGKIGTWIVPEMLAAYCALHDLGFAHSIEVWEDNELVGGVYGVALGQAFFGESMFYERSNASKAGLVILSRALHGAGFTLFDCQQVTRHMLNFGAQIISRAEFLTRLAQAVDQDGIPGKWRLTDCGLTSVR